VPDGWRATKYSIEDLATLLYEKNEPVVFINDRAELGPRALGNRSILASPESAQMKDVLNKVKQREAYRPVSPICMEEYASEIFTPGNKDPFMLFDHRVKPQWKDRIPAVVHLDDTARLQTVTAQQNPVIYRLLEAFRDLSGIPLLCNTSANLNGSGFFPDAQSAMAWNQVNYVFDGCWLYERVEKIDFREPAVSEREALVS
jgi:carbamoyltransferase